MKPLEAGAGTMLDMSVLKETRCWKGRCDGIATATLWRDSEPIARPAGDITAKRRLSKTNQEFRPDDVIAGRFRICRFLGRGGMGDVYKVYDLAIRSTPAVALKVIRPGVANDPEMIERFQHEVEVSRSVTHPNVCRVYDLGVHCGRDFRLDYRATPFVTMEFLTGRTLAMELRERGPIGVSEALPLIRQIAAALNAVHEAGFVHCDLKPGNIMVGPLGDQNFRKAVLMDFGLAMSSAVGRQKCSVLGHPQPVCGTPDYMSPEQVMGGAMTVRSDIYSFGILIYEMLTGALPFRGSNARNRMRKRLTTNPTPMRTYLAGADIELERVTHRCLSLDPHDRFNRAIEVAVALDPPALSASRELVASKGRTANDLAAEALNRYLAR